MSWVRIAVVVVVVLMGSAGVSAQQYQALGIGNSSCALWQSDPRRTNEGIAYMYGVFTALNMTNPKDKFVGKNTDSSWLIGELTKVCKQRPSMVLIDAITEVYSSQMQNK